MSKIRKLLIFIMALLCPWLLIFRHQHTMIRHLVAMDQPTKLTKVNVSQTNLTDHPIKLNVSDHATKSSPPVVYIITPTYVRPTQQPDLTRLTQTLMNVQLAHWIVIEDSPVKTKFVTQLLQRYGRKHTHLNVVTPKTEKAKKIRGCAQRNAALTWLKKNINEGVIYFADDDNTYDIRLFNEIRYTKKVGLTPTANFPHAGFSSPIVKKGTVVGFVDPFIAKRKFPVDMASISVNVAFWLSQGAPMFGNTTAGYLETKFLESLKINLTDIEPKANNCTQVFAWHTKTWPVSPSRNYKMPNNTSDSNIPVLLGRKMSK